MLELIGRYRIHEQIGEGAMADVYRAHDPQIDRSLAIKVLKPEFREDREYAARFLREARAAGALSHPGIVTVFDVGEVDGYPFIVMELLEGEPLSEVLKRGALPPSSVIGVGIQLADALAYAHNQGVIHRDVKPSNIILSPDGRSLKLLDFGIAQVSEADPLFDEKSYRTQIGQVLGTPRYMSPEQAMGQEMDGRSDLYSVGVVLYEMLSGRRAFPAGNAAALTAQIISVDPAQLSEVAPDTPRGLQFIVHKAMAKQPLQRFADAGRMADALRREYSVAEVVAREADAHRTYLPLQVRLTLILALVTSLVLAAAVGTVLFKQREAMKQVALSSGSAISAFVANNAALRAADNAALPPEQQDWVPVQAFVKNAAADPNLRGLMVIDAGGTVRAAIDESRIGKPYRVVPGEAIANRDGIAITAAEDGRSFRFVRPITYADRNFGRVDVLLDQSTLRSAARIATWLQVLLAIVTIGAVALGTFLSARLLQAPIARLRAALLDLARGNLDFRISHSRQDEFGELFDDVNLVAQTMQERLSSVEALLLDRPADPQDKPRPPVAQGAATVALGGMAAAVPDAAAMAPITVHSPNERPIAPVENAASRPVEIAPMPVADDVEEDAEEDAVEEDVAPLPAPPEPMRAEPVQAAGPAPQKIPDPAEEPEAADAEDDLPLRQSGHLAPPWPHDEDEDRTLVDPDNY